MRKPGLICALVLLAACNGSEIVDPPVTTTVAVTITPAQIAVGETAQATALVKDQDGNALTGRPTVWASLNQSIATVTGQGLVRGVAPGTATIQATVDGIAGTATIEVFQPSAVCATPPVTLDFTPGQVRVVSVRESSGCIKIASSQFFTQYFVIAANTNAVPDVVGTFTMRVDAGETVPANNLLASPSRIAGSLALRETPSPLSLQSEFEKQLRLSERRELDLSQAQRAYAGGTLRRSVSGAAGSSIPSVGEKTQFKVPKSCTDTKTVTATVRHISTRAIIYTDDASPPNGFSDTDLQEIGREFDNLIYPTGVDYFGTPLDLDDNSRIVILYTPLVNVLTPRGNPDGFVGGFFFGGDLFPTTQCRDANRAEIFYLLSPDPTGIHGDPRTVSAVRQGTRGTIAHEFQHMINASERIRHPVTEALESVWLDEALSHFAEDLNGRVLRGLSETGNYTFEQLVPTNAHVNDYNAFFFQNFARFQRYIQNPAPRSPTSKETENSLADRGAAWALLRYTADHYAPGGNVKAFIKSLVPGPDTGVVNLLGRTSGVAFDSLIAGWLVTNQSDDLGPLPAKYSYRTYNMRSNVARVQNPPSPVYPLFFTDITGPSVTVAGVDVRSGSGYYFRLNGTPGAPARIFRFSNTNLTTAATFGGAVFIVVRTQ